MTGVIYLKSNKQIIGIVPDVVSHTETDITGKEVSVRGIDLTQASFCIVASDANYEVGDILGEFTDIRQTLPISEVEQLKQQVAELTEIVILNMGGA